MNIYTNLCSKVFEYRGEVDRGPRSDPLSISPSLEEPSDPADWELKTGLLGLGDRFGGLGLASAALGGCRRCGRHGGFGDWKDFWYSLVG